MPVSITELELTYQLNSYEFEFLIMNIDRHLRMFYPDSPPTFTERRLLPEGWCAAVQQIYAEAGWSVDVCETAGLATDQTDFTFTPRGT